MSETGRYALIISNSEYEDPKLISLPAPEVDAELLAQVLRDPEIGAFRDVKIVSNVTAQEARIAIENFFADKGLNDLLLLYFSGHGILDKNNRLYLAARDTHFRTESAILRKATAIEAAFIRDEMNNTRSRRIVLVLDCCHSGAFEEGAKSATDVAVGTGAAFEGNGIGRVVMTASDATQFAWQGSTLVEGEANGSSVFTQAIVEGLKSGDADVDHDGRISIHELYEYVQHRVKELATEQKPQTPRIWTFGQRGEFLIAHAARREEAARELYREVARLMQDDEWPAAEEKWLALQKRFPDFNDEYHIAQRMEQWKEAKARYVEMQRLVLARHGANALDVWASIKKDFPNFPDTRHLVREAQEALKQAQQRQWLDQRYAEMKAFGEQRQWGRVLQLWQEILEVDPYYPDHEHLAQQAQEARAEKQRLEEAEALKRRLDRFYAEMEQFVAERRWKEAEQRWQVIRSLDQSYEDTKHLVVKIRVGLKEEEAQQQARKRRAYLDAQYQQVIEHVERQEWQAAYDVWQKIVATDRMYPDHNNLLPAIQKQLSGSRQQSPEMVEQPAGDKRRGCVRPLVALGAMGVFGLVMLVVGGIAGLAWLMSIGTSTPTPPIASTAPIAVTLENEPAIFLTEEPAFTMPTPYPTEMISCPYVDGAFALFVNVPYGPFQAFDGFTYAIGFDGFFIYTTDEFGQVFSYTLPTVNQWTPLNDSPFTACVDSFGQYYAWFDPNF